MNRTHLTYSLIGIPMVLIPLGCGLFGGGSDAPKVSGCPENSDEVNRLAWELKESAELPIRSGLLASLELNGLATVMDDELTTACTNLATELFAKKKQLEPDEYAVGAEAQKACSVVSESLEKLKAIAGGSLSIAAQPVLCTTKMDAANTCLDACHEEGKPPKVECEGEVSGKCVGSCSGQCTVQDDSECSGTCSGLCEGSCDSEFTGICRGTCEGTCDGKNAQGECQGTCNGRCLAGAEGTCGGSCLGSCKGDCTVEAAGECAGVCSGQCDQPFQNTQCTGAVGWAGKVSNCEASCEPLLLASLECTPPRVSVEVVDESNEEAARLIETAFNQHLPKILAAVALNLDPARVEQSVELSNRAVNEMKKASTAKGAELSRKSKSCISDKVKSQEDTAAGIITLLQAAETIRAATQGD